MLQQRAWQGDDQGLWVMHLKSEQFGQALLLASRDKAGTAGPPAKQYSVYFKGLQHPERNTNFHTFANLALKGTEAAAGLVLPTPIWVCRQPNEREIKISSLLHSTHITVLLWGQEESFFTAAR